MNNIHVLPTENYSPLVHSTNRYGGFFKSEHYSPMKEMGDSYQNIYITSDEEIKDGDWMIRDNEQPIKVTKNFFWDFGVRYYKIILTTDQDLIKDGVQAIDDDFLKWFVKNPSCEEVEVELIDTFKKTNEVYVDAITVGNYYEIIKHNKIIIPTEEPEQEDEIIDISDHDGIGNAVDNLNDEPPPKQETLEEAEDFAKTKYGPTIYGLERVNAFKDGAKWMRDKIQGGNK